MSPELSRVPAWLFSRGNSEMTGENRCWCGLALTTIIQHRASFISAE